MRFAVIGHGIVVRDDLDLRFARAALRDFQRARNVGDRIVLRYILAARIHDLRVVRNEQVIILARVDLAAVDRYGFNRLILYRRGRVVADFAVRLAVVFDGVVLRGNRDRRRQNLQPAVRYLEGHVLEVAVQVMEVFRRKAHHVFASVRFRRDILARLVFEIAFLIQRVRDARHLIAGHSLLGAVIGFCLRIAHDRHDYLIGQLRDFELAELRFDRVVLGKRVLVQRVGELVLALADAQLAAGHVIGRAFAVRKAVVGYGHGVIRQRFAVVNLLAAAARHDHGALLDLQLAVAGRYQIVADLRFHSGFDIHAVHSCDHVGGLAEVGKRAFSGHEHGEYVAVARRERGRGESGLSQRRAVVLAARVARGDRHLHRVDHHRAVLDHEFNIREVRIHVFEIGAQDAERIRACVGRGRRPVCLIVRHLYARLHVVEIVIRNHARIAGHGVLLRVIGEFAAVFSDRHRHLVGHGRHGQLARLQRNRIVLRKRRCGQNVFLDHVVAFADVQLAADDGRRRDAFAGNKRALRNRISVLRKLRAVVNLLIRACRQFNFDRRDRKRAAHLFHVRVLVAIGDFQFNDFVVAGRCVRNVLHCLRDLRGHGIAGGKLRAFASLYGIAFFAVGYGVTAVSVFLSVVGPAIAVRYNLQFLLARSDFEFAFMTDDRIVPPIKRGARSEHDRVHDAADLGDRADRRHVAHFTFNESAINGNVRTGQRRAIVLLLRAFGRKHDLARLNRQRAVHAMDGELLRYVVSCFVAHDFRADDHDRVAIEHVRAFLARRKSFNRVFLSIHGELGVFQA